MLLRPHSPRDHSSEYAWAGAVLRCTAARGVPGADTGGAPHAAAATPSPWGRFSECARADTVHLAGHIGGKLLVIDCASPRHLYSSGISLFALSARIRPIDLSSLICPQPPYPPRLEREALREVVEHSPDLLCTSPGVLKASCRWGERLPGLVTALISSPSLLSSIYQPSVIPIAKIHKCSRLPHSRSCRAIAAQALLLPHGPERGLGRLPAPTGGLPQEPGGRARLRQRPVRPHYGLLSSLAP